MTPIKVFEQRGSRSVGIYEENGQFLAMTFTQSKIFKTQQGAERWLAARGYKGAR